MSQPLDLSSFEKAHATLVDVLAVDSTDPVVQILWRDAMIQRFEYTYEIACKMLRRHLESANHSSANIDELPFRDLIRVGAEAGLIRSPEKWFQFREMRNITSHAYDESKAIRICAIIPEFAEESGALLLSLKERNT